MRKIRDVKYIINNFSVYLPCFGNSVWGGHPNFFGKTGVGFFFALSGYCLMQIYHNGKWNIKKITYFYIKRALTIYPCLLITLGLGYVINILTWPDIQKILSLRGGKFHFWSISVNIVFYIMFPILSIIIKKIGNKISIALLWIILILWAIFFTKINIGVLIYVPACFSGVLIYLHKECLDKKVDDKKDIVSVIPVIVFAFSGAIIYGISSMPDISIEAIKNVLGSMVCSLCLYFVFTRKSVKEFLNNRRLVLLHFIGRISYEIYLTHLIVLMLIVKATRGADSHSLLSEVIVSFGVTIIISMMLHYLIQRPINKFMRRIKLKLECRN